MVVKLKAIAVRYGGKCAKCGREIKVGWDAFYDSATKDMYCRPCSKEVEAGASDSLDMITQEEFDLLSPEMQAKISKAGLVKTPSIEDTLLYLEGDIALAISNLGAIQTTIGVISASQAEILKSIADLAKLIEEKAKS